MQKKTWVDNFGKVSMVLLCLFWLECMFGGNGSLLSWHGIKLRHILWGLTVLTAIPITWQKRKQIIKQPVFWSTVMFVLWLAIEAWRGIQNGNDMTILKMDLMGYSGFLLLPCLISLFSEFQVHVIENILFFFGSLLGIGILVVSYWIDPEWKDFYLAMREYGIGFTGGYIATNTLRVFFNSSCFVLFSAVMGIYLAHISPRKWKWLYIILTGVCFAAMIISYTRSLYLALGTMVIGILICGLICDRKDGKRAIGRFLISVLMAFAILVFLMATQYSHPIEAAVSRVTGMEVKEIQIFKSTKKSSSQSGSIKKKKKIQKSEELDALEVESLQLRTQTMAEHSRLIQESPAIGHGLGLPIAFRTNGLSEYFYLDLWGKTGTIGLVLYMFPLLWCIVRMFRYRKRNSEGSWETGAWIFGVGTLFVVSLFNPYMSSSIGVSLYSAMMAVAATRNR